MKKILQYYPCRFLALKVIAGAVKDFERNSKWRIQNKLPIYESRFFIDEESDLGFWCNLAEIDLDAVRESHCRLKKKMESKGE